MFVYKKTIQHRLLLACACSVFIALPGLSHAQEARARVALTESADQPVAEPSAVKKSVMTQPVMTKPAMTKEPSVIVGPVKKPRPLWELGVGLGGLHQPYYVGTKQNRTFAFPVPVPIYRGDIFKSDDDGIRAELIKNKRYQLDLSLDFNLAVDSSEVDLRQDMNDVGSLLQIGPSLEFTLSKNDRNEWLLNLPVRANLEFDGGIDEAGYTFAPNITYFNRFNWRGKSWRAGAALGPQFGSTDYQNTYYGVASEFATENRPEFSADSGYSGSRLLLSLRSKDKDRLWVWFLRYENISGATFEDSPLVETNHGLSVGVIYSRFLFKSKHTVAR